MKTKIISKRGAIPISKRTVAYYCYSQDDDDDHDDNNNASVSNKKKKKKKAHYNFEQTMDIYTPATSTTTTGSSTTTNINNNNNNDTTCSPHHHHQQLPVVLLVVGSAWMGHRSLCYSVTSWWNASGPLSIARLGTTCVCIRHRGAFLAGVVNIMSTIGTRSSSSNNNNWSTCSSSNNSLCYCSWIMMMMMIAILMAMLATNNNNNTVLQTVSLLIVALVFVIIIVTVHLANRGAATLEDMHDDVLAALTYIQRHQDLLTVGTNNNASKSLSSTTTTENNINNNTNDKSSSSPIVLFGGYSSGAHVAATLVQHPKFQNSDVHNSQLVDGYIYISGVLGLAKLAVSDASSSSSSTLDTATTKTPLRTSLSSSISKEDCHSTTNHDYYYNNDINWKRDGSWCTNFVLRAVWGSTIMAQIPCPLRNIMDHHHRSTPPPPRQPHLLIGCRHEIPFGLSWLDVFFASPEFARRLRQRFNNNNNNNDENDTSSQTANAKTNNATASSSVVPVIYRTVQSDHWNILASNELHEVLREELSNLTAYFISNVDDQQKGRLTKKIK